MADTTTFRNPQHHQQQQFGHNTTTDSLKDYFTPQSGPTPQQIIALVTLLPIGGILLGLSGLTFVGTSIGLAVATPLFILFSPVIVPAALTLMLAVAGFLASGAFGITALSSLFWLANYVRWIRSGSGSGSGRWAGREHLDFGKWNVQDPAVQKSVRA